MSMSRRISENMYVQPGNRIPPSSKGDPRDDLRNASSHDEHERMVNKDTDDDVEDDADESDDLEDEDHGDEDTDDDENDVDTKESSGGGLKEDVIHADDASSALPTVNVTFASLGVCAPLCDAIAALGWKAPTRIQAETLPLTLAGRDIIGLAETGSGKTAAFALPILQALLESPASRLFACVLAPTRELAFQIAEQFEALGASLGVRTAVVVGGVDMVTQAIALARKPHVIVGTPGRVVDHLENTRGFSLRSLRYFVLDEADRMLSLDFEDAINTVLAAIPRDGRRTMLFSATMTSKVAKLQRASLHDPVRIEVSDKYGTVAGLVSQYLFIPARHKETYLAYVLSEFAGQSAMVFAATCAGAQRAALMLSNLGFPAVCLHGQMSQPKRLAALARFRAGARGVLVATDVASRGLDIPCVDLVLNYDVPSNGKDYIHRVGRTARAGRAGRAITFVTQYDVELYQRIEHLLGRKLDEFPASEAAALTLASRVAEAARLAALEMRESGEGGGHGAHAAAAAAEGGDDDVEGVLKESKRKRARLGEDVAAAGARSRGGARGRGRGGGRGGAFFSRGSGGSRGGGRGRGGGGRGRGGR